MAQQRRDDWDKPRTQGEHFTTAEIAKMRAAFNAGRRADDIACELQCSTRNVNKYYSKFRGIPRTRGRPPPGGRAAYLPPQESKPAPKSRFYTSTFELEDQNA